MARYTVLELTESEAKVLQVVKTKKTPLSIEQALVVDLADLEKDEAGSVQRGTRIREKLKERKIVPGAVGMIIPKQNSIVRTAQLPSSDALELQGMALFEAEVTAVADEMGEALGAVIHPVHVDAPDPDVFGQGGEAAGTAGRALGHAGGHMEGRHLRRVFHGLLRRPSRRSEALNVQCTPRASSLASARSLRP